MKRQHLRELGFYPGEIQPGEFNAITDVPGIQVGHATLVHGEGDLIPGSGPVRTGVTVLKPHGGNIFLEKVPAAVYTLNGFGKVAGFEQTRELGLIEAPIALTNTLNVGLVLDALVGYALKQNPGIGIEAGSGSINIIVGETNDSYLNDIQGRHVKLEHVWSALENASSGPVREGAVGAGTGTMCFGWKGGIGTASRILPEGMGGFIIGALLQTNFGSRRDLTILGVPVGRHLPAERVSSLPLPGSVMVILATNAPLDARQLKRLCLRAAGGLARTGAQFQHGSGDFVVAFSTANRVAHRAETTIGAQEMIVQEEPLLNLLFRCAGECVEEAVLNSLTCAETVIGRDEHLAEALPLEQVVELLNRFGPKDGGSKD